MKIVNKTKYPTKMLRDIAEFCKPKKIKRITVSFNWRQNRYGVTGRYYPSQNLISVTLPKKDLCQYPRIEKYHGGYLPSLHIDREDEIVHVVAHEFRHAEQDHRPRIHRVYGYQKGSKFSERDADAYAIKIQRAWRKTYKVVLVDDPVGCMENNTTYYGHN